MGPRYKKVLEILKQQKVDSFLLSSVAQITYVTGYFNFSSEEREAFVLITKDKGYILTDGRYSTAIKKQVTHLELIELSSSYRLEDALRSLIDTNAIQSIGIEENNLTFSEYKILNELIKNIYPAQLHLLRIQKEDSEVKKIDTACSIGDKAFEYSKQFITHGISEKELALKLELFIKKQGADVSFPPIVAFGPNAAIPHHATGKDKLTENSFVLVDFGVKVEGYCSDMTRTVFFGKATNEQKKIYKTVLEGQKKAITYIKQQLATNNSFVAKKTKEKNNILASDIDKQAREYILSQGYPSIPHSLGHGIGLQVHEPPTLSPISHQMLSEGMIFSIEPGIYIPDFGGVRIEDLFIIKHRNLEQLTNAPKAFIELP